MDDPDVCLRDELERLARAHQVAESHGDVDGGDSTIDITPEIAATLQQALHANLTGAHADMTALASIPDTAPLPAPWLFRLDLPVATPVLLEAKLSLPPGSLLSLSATRAGSDEMGAEDVQFVFVDEATKRKIEGMIAEGHLDVIPLFVKVTKTGG